MIDYKNCNRAGSLPADFDGVVTMEQAIEIVFQPGFSTNEVVTDHPAVLAWML